MKAFRSIKTAIKGIATLTVSGNGNFRVSKKAKEVMGLHTAYYDLYGIEIDVDLFGNVRVCKVLMKNNVFALPVGRSPSGTIRFYSQSARKFILESLELSSEIPFHKFLLNENPDQEGEKTLFRLEAVADE